MRAIGKLIVAAVVALAAIQFVRPGIGNPPVTAEIAAPEPVKAVLRKSCYNCHSNETRLSWFDQPVPAYWLVARDVKTAREHLNFSEIGKLPPAAQKGMLYEAVNMIKLGAMPLPSYRMAHPGAEVSAADLAMLEAYLAPFDTGGGAMTGGAMMMMGPARPAMMGPAMAGSAMTGTVAHASPGSSLASVPADLNGVPFFPDFESWKPVSTTDRGDNHTLREILGNEIAIRAIAEKDVTPWPDGAALAKIAWQAVPDGMGGLKQGKFIQVEFMVKDAKKYASTVGWGFGRWRGLELKPYGKDAHFDNECVSCHLPVKGNDYVYSMPLERSAK